MNPAYNDGDFVIIKDHINLPGLGALNPLKGLCDDRYLSTLQQCFSNFFFEAELFAAAMGIARNLSLGEGVLWELGRMILVLGYWVLRNIHRYWVVLLWTVTINICKHK